MSFKKFVRNLFKVNNIPKRSHSRDFVNYEQVSQRV